MTLMMKTILASGEISRAEIAGRLGLTRSTVSTLTQEMLESGYIIETGSKNESTERGGRPGVNLRINTALGCILGIYILSGEYRYVLTDLSGKVLVSDKKDTADGDLADAVRAAAVAAAASAEGSSRNIVGVSLAVPGIIDGAGSIKRSEEFGLINYNFNNEIASAFAVPVMLFNDVRACGTGQLFFNEKNRNENFIYLFGRTRKKMGVEYPVVSTALVFHGSIINGRESRAGEFPGWYRKKMLKGFVSKRIGFLLGREGDDEIIDEIMLLIGYLDPDKIYIGAGLIDHQDTIREIWQSRKDTMAITADSVFSISDLAGYAEYEVCTGAALSFLNRLYTIPQIGDSDKSNIDLASIGGLTARQTVKLFSL